MKKFNKFLIPALALGLFAACSDDKMDNPATPEDNTNVDRVQYLNISICSPSTTGGRATDIPDEKFQPGDDSENLIRDAFFVFYDINGNYLAQKKLTKDDLGAKDPNLKPDANEELYHKTISIEIEKGKPNPAYVMCYLNPVDIDGDGTNALASKTIGDIKEIKREQVCKTEGSDTYFGMSNAVYYSGNSLVRATEIPDGALKSTEAETKQDGVPSVKIYVERYAAKVGVRTANDNVVDGTTVGDYTLEFVPKKWLLNAREKEFFVSKSFTATETGNGMGSMGTENATTQQVGLSWSWNDEANKRSYWARSVSYFWNKFPEVSSDVTTIPKLPLTYYTYDEIISNGFNVTKDGNSVYALENTIGKNAANSDNTLAALSSVVIAGEYKLKKGTETYDNNVTFYVLDGKQVYFKHDDSNKKLGDKALHQGLLVKNTTLVRRSGDGSKDNPYSYTAVTDPSEQEVAIFEIYNVAEVFNGTGTKYNEQEVSVRVKSGATLSGLNLFYYDNGNLVELKANNIDAMNKKLLADIGTADAYTAGKCFFSIPIRHTGFYRENNPNNQTGATMDWTKIEEGDFGIVRNHIYDLSIRSIKGLANGVCKPENPIVPERTKTTYVAKYDLYIESWKCVRTQHVTL